VGRNLIVTNQNMFDNKSRLGTLSKGINVQNNIFIWGKQHQ